jgi:hypothetical protein
VISRVSVAAQYVVHPLPMPTTVVCGTMGTSALHQNTIKYHSQARSDVKKRVTVWTDNMVRGVTARTEYYYTGSLQAARTGQPQPYQGDEYCRAELR